MATPLIVVETKSWRAGEQPLLSSLPAWGQET